MFIKKNNLAILLFSSTSKSEETKLFVDINKIPSDIDILDFSYKSDLSSNIVEKDLSYLNNSVYSIYSINKSTAGAIEYAFSMGYDYVFYSHHDIFNLTADAYLQIQKLCNSNKLNSFGIVGFNIYHDKEILNWDKNVQALQTTAKTFLQPGNGWWSTSPVSAVDHKKFPLNCAFSVEIPHWACCLVGSKSYSNIDHKPISDFNLCLDDMAYDFLKNNIHNICIPWISFAHQQSLSVIFGRSYKSPLPISSNMMKAKLNWLKKWGFPLIDFYTIGTSKLKIVNHLLLIYREFIRCKLPIRFQNSSIINYLKKNELQKKLPKGLFKNYYNYNPKNGTLKNFTGLTNEKV